MKKELSWIFAGAALFAAGFLVGEYPVWLSPALFVCAYLVTGASVIFTAIKNIFKGELFDENFLMSVASIGAFFVGEFPEAAAVMLFYRIGELFQDYAVERSKRSITALMDLRPDRANLKTENGFLSVSPDEVEVGAILLVKPGERIPIDGTILSGSSSLDTAALTGESIPREVQPGDEALSGCVNLTGALEIQTKKLFAQSAVSRILELVQSANEKKSAPEKFITKFARIYTPAVVLAAFLIALVPPLVLPGATFSTWLYRALSFLVVSCPCALVISVPLSFFAGMGGASRSGILIKGATTLEGLATADTVLFDKTGTLTRGIFEVQKICPSGIPEEELLFLAACAESSSSHPISQSLLRAYGKKIDPKEISAVSEFSGRGVSAFVGGRTVLAGNEKLMRDNGISVPEIRDSGTLVHVAVDGSYSGFFVIADAPKPEAERAILSLKALGIRKVEMLTGDRIAAAQRVADMLPLDAFYSELLPEGKVQVLEKALSEKEKHRSVLFVGDGINDSPVLALADVGVAMGGLGSDAAIEAADAVIMTDSLSVLPAAIRGAKRTLRIARENIIFAIAVKLIVLALVTMGLATMWAAVFADVGVSLLAVLNALRALKKQT